ncbi:SLC13 family permease [Arcobacter aquimarinus]|uniref:Divalent anion:sodium symporter family protein n=1 Tax=Arcobacter aquimarinus TaxID=1315211 RepID=A0AAE7B1T2_9BACT|nr:SLC13 family permease [Arcobacter aquimarinus]QKE25878.1 putative divalent anion:sodium symporter family protein [Arcobacter aquimarinus]RXI35619.1 sodium:sulfate symporter [Arcobacter aquimarinus]
MIKNILFFIIPILIYFIASNFIFDTKNLILISLLTTTIIFWATSIIPNYQTSLIFLFTCLIFSLSSKDIIFSGFSSSAFWLVFAGMLIASAIKNVNLSERFSTLFSSIKNPNYLNILIFINIFSLLFSFVMPSSLGRTVLLIPIAMIVAKNFGFKEKDKGYTGIMLAFIFSTVIPAFTILPANVPNMILSGLTYEIYGFELLYSHYLVANFFVLGFIKNLILVALLYFMYNDTPKYTFYKSEKNILSKDEKTVIYTTFTMILFWATDFIHGISASVIAIVGVLFLANPTINIIKTKDVNSINFASLLLVAAIISFGNIVATNDYIKEVLTSIINLYKPTEYKVLNQILISSFMSFTGIFITQPSIPAIFTPMAEHISSISSFSLNEVIMMEVSAFSTLFLPYQSPPIIIGLALANIKQTQAIKFLLILAVITIIFLFPLQYYWMQFVKNII